MSEMVEMLLTFSERVQIRGDFIAEIGDFWNLWKTEEEDDQNIYHHEWLGLDKDIENKYICQFTGWDPDELVTAQKKANIQGEQVGMCYNWNWNRPNPI